jgi:hypothetical protein
MFFDQKLWKEFGFMVVGIWGLFGPVMGYLLNQINLHMIWIIFIVGSWELVDAFILGIVLHYFNIDQSELPPKVSKLLPHEIAEKPPAVPTIM